MPRVIKVSSYNYSDKPGSVFMLVADRGDEIEVWVSPEDLPVLADRVATAWQSGLFTEGDDEKLDAIGFGLSSAFVSEIENMSDRKLAEETDGWQKGQIDETYLNAITAPRRPKKAIPFKELISKKKK